MSKATFRYCERCRGERQVDGETFRCLTCGMQTKFGSGQPASNSAAAPTAIVQTHGASVTLPASARSRQWIQQTQALADNFAKAAREAEARAMAATAEAERLRRASSAFLGLLKQVDVEQIQPTPSGKTGGRWARNFDACTVCGRTEIKHASRGLCRSCDSKKRNAA